MTYHKDETKAFEDSPFDIALNCLCCGEPAKGPTIGYDLVLPGTSHYTRVPFHRDCAFAMAQRMICDAWPNRRDGELMRNNR